MSRWASRRARPPCRRSARSGIPILLVSGYIGGKVTVDALEAGADQVLKRLLARELTLSLVRILFAPLAV